MTALLPVTVEIAFNAGYKTPAASRTWTNVSAYVEADEGVAITRGRSDELSGIEPSRLTLTLDNRDGRFTPDYASGAYYPNVKKGRPIRVSVTYNAVTYTRFLGYIDEWPIQWPDGSQTFSTVTVTATSRRARMANGATLRTIISEEYLLDDPDGYYPLTEPTSPSGGQTGSNIAATTQPVLVRTAGKDGVAGSMSFGAGAGPLTDGDLPCAAFTPSTSTKGRYLRSTNFGPITGGAVTLECFFATFNSTGTGYGAPGRGAYLVTLADDVVGPPYFKIGIDPTGTYVRVKLHDGTTPFFFDGLTAVNDGATHHILAYAVSGDRMALYVDGVYDGQWFISPFNLDANVLSVGGDRDGTDLWLGEIAHVAVYGSALTDTTRIAAHADAGLTGFDGESSGSRVTRLAAYAGIPATEISADSGSSTVAWQPTEDSTPLDLATTVETTENGLFFDGKDGTFTFKDRDTRYGATTAFTLDASLDEVQSDIEPTYNDQFLLNDVTVTSDNLGINYRAQDTTSIDNYGYYRADITAITTVDSEVADAANWRVQKNKDPGVRIPSVTVDVNNVPTSLLPSLLNADISTKFAVTNMPSQAPAPTLSFFVEGYTETIGTESYTIGFYVSPSVNSEVWIVEDAVYGDITTYGIAY